MFALSVESVFPSIGQVFQVSRASWREPETFLGGFPVFGVTLAGRFPRPGVQTRPWETPADVRSYTGNPSSKGLTRRRSNGINHQGSHNVWKALPPTGETLPARRACQE